MNKLFKLIISSLFLIIYISVFFSICKSSYNKKIEMKMIDCKDFSIINNIETKWDNKNNSCLVIINNHKITLERFNELLLKRD